MALAIFDLDNTLLGGDSDYLWGEFMIEKGMVDASEFKQQNDRFYQDYLKGTLDLLAYLEFALVPLTQHDYEHLDALHAEFMQQYIEPIILPASEKLIATHREQKDTLLVITATNEFIVAPIVKKLGIPNMLATELERGPRTYTGKVTGLPSFQHGKVERLRFWINQYDESLWHQEHYFYSDSFNDLPLLEQVQRPFAVDPDEQLAAQAKTRNWPIISLR